MKILSLSTIPLLPYLGSGKTRLMWTEGLKNLGHEVTVLQPSDFEFLSFIKKGTQLRMAIGILIAVNKSLKTHQYDLIELYGDQHWLLLLWLKKIRKHRSLFVGHVDGNELHDMDKAQLYFNQRKGLKKWFYDNTHRRFSIINYALLDKYVCGCQDDLEYVIKRKMFSEKDAICISPGIEDFYHQIIFTNNKEKVICFLGSWIERKGIKFVPEVVTSILEQYPDYKFHIYGAWSSKNVILSLFPDSVSNRVIVFEKLEAANLIKEIINSAILFFPSFSEGFGLGTAESMSCGCAVVTTRTGLGSQLNNNREALLVDFLDVEGMKSALSNLIYDENLRIKIAYGGFMRAKEFNWEKQIHLLEKTYSSWLKSN